jgi:N-acetylmuramoyl-L-alanine amidase
MVQPPLILNYRISIGGVEYFPLKNVADYQGISIEWDSLNQKAVLYKDGQYLSFVVGEPFYLLNEQVGAMSYPVRLVKGKILIPKELAFKPWWRRQAVVRPFEATISRLPFQKGALGINTIVLDPGHGGKDTGARAWGIREKDIVLQIAKRVRDKLKANGVNVIMTRETDRFIPLPGRAMITNKSNADLFISIHANASPSRDPYGFEVYYLSEALDDNARAAQILENADLQYEENAIFPNKNSKDPTVWDLVLTENRKESLELAKLILKNVHQSRLTSTRGVKGARFHVLKWTDKPAILIETGFVTNWQEVRKLTNARYQDALATQITRGILEYKESFERTNGFTR